MCSKIQYLLTEDLTVCLWGTESYSMEFGSHIFRGEFERQNKGKKPTKLLFCINFTSNCLLSSLSLSPVF